MRPAWVRREASEGVTRHSRTGRDDVRGEGEAERQSVAGDGVIGGGAGGIKGRGGGGGRAAGAGEPSDVAAGVDGEEGRLGRGAKVGTDDVGERLEGQGPKAWRTWETRVGGDDGGLVEKMTASASREKERRQLRAAEVEGVVAARVETRQRPQ